jgi:hypothetical protein
MDTLTSSPYSYSFDGVVYVRVSAYNSYGYGSTSDINTSGAQIRSVPGKVSDPYAASGSTDYELYIEWDALTGTDTGNSDILSYSLVWDDGTGTVD